MTSLSDPQLLRAYAERRSEAAFAELVRRPVDLVHSAAQRMVCDPHLAKDVSQGVFVALARNAGKLAKHPVLAGWLHQTARNIAAHTLRTETRRRRREQQAATMIESADADARWEQIALHLDAVLSELAAADRDAVLLRYFENKPAQEMAAILGISAEAAQKRVNRAVAKLRENFSKRGVAAGTTVLTGVVSANAVQAAPAGLASAISSASLAGGASAAAAATAIFAMTVLKKSLAATVVVALAGTAIYQVTRRPEVDGQARRESIKASSASRAREPREEKSVVERLAKAREEKPPIDRKAELERLKVRWMASDVKNGIITKEHEKLAGETAKALLCGREALELVGFLATNQREIAADVVRDGISKYLASQDDPEARKLLTDLSNDKRQGDPYGPVAEWSKAAGRSCSAEELEEFRSELKNGNLAQEALLGYNSALMRTDPEAALRSTVEALAANVDSYTTVESIERLFSEELPADVDFAKLESLLPTDLGAGRSNGDPLETGRQGLFRTWAKTDPAAAANYVISHPDRVAPKFVQQIVGSQYYKDRDGLIAWVSQFPEGPHFDHAAASAAVYARGQPGIFELIGKIRDPQLRAEAEKNAKVPLTNPGTR